MTAANTLSLVFTRDRDASTKQNFGRSGNRGTEGFFPSVYVFSSVANEPVKTTQAVASVTD